MESHQHSTAEQGLSPPPVSTAHQLVRRTAECAAGSAHQHISMSSAMVAPRGDAESESFVHPQLHALTASSSAGVSRPGLMQAYQMPQSTHNSKRTRSDTESDEFHQNQQQNPTSQPADPSHEQSTVRLPPNLRQQHQQREHQQEQPAEVQLQQHRLQPLECPPKAPQQGKSEDGGSKVSNMGEADCMPPTKSLYHKDDTLSLRHVHHTANSAAVPSPAGNIIPFGHRDVGPSNQLWSPETAAAAAAIFRPRPRSSSLQLLQPHSQQLPQQGPRYFDHGDNIVFPPSSLFHVQPPPPNTLPSMSVLDLKKQKKKQALQAASKGVATASGNYNQTQYDYSKPKQPRAQGLNNDKFVKQAPSALGWGDAVPSRRAPRWSALPPAAPHSLVSAPRNASQPCPQDGVQATSRGAVEEKRQLLEALRASALVKRAASVAAGIESPPDEDEALEILPHQGQSVVSGSMPEEDPAQPMVVKLERRVHSKDRRLLKLGMDEPDGSAAARNSFLGGVTDLNSSSFGHGGSGIGGSSLSLPVKVNRQNVSQQQCPGQKIKVTNQLQQSDWETPAVMSHSAMGPNPTSPEEWESKTTGGVMLHVPGSASLTSAPSAATFSLNRCAGTCPERCVDVTKLPGLTEFWENNRVQHDSSGVAVNRPHGQASRSSIQPQGDSRVPASEESTQKVNLLYPVLNPLKQAAHAASKLVTSMPDSAAQRQAMSAGDKHDAVNDADAAPSLVDTGAELATPSSAAWIAGASMLAVPATAVISGTLTQQDLPHALCAATPSLLMKHATGHLSAADLGPMLSVVPPSSVVTCSDIPIKTIPLSLFSVKPHLAVAGQKAGSFQTQAPTLLPAATRPQETLKQVPSHAPAAWGFTSQASSMSDAAPANQCPRQNLSSLLSSASASRNLAGAAGGRAWEGGLTQQAHRSSASEGEKNKHGGNGKGQQKKRDSQGSFKQPQDPLTSCSTPNPFQAPIGSSVLVGSVSWSTNAKALKKHLCKGLGEEFVVRVQLQPASNFQEAVVQCVSAAAAARLVTMHGSVLHKKTISVTLLPVPALPTEGPMGSTAEPSALSHDSTSSSPPATQGLEKRAKLGSEEAD